MQHLLCPRSIVLLLTISVISNCGCDPAYSLWINNKSGRDRRITILYNDRYTKDYHSCPWPGTYFMNSIVLSRNDSTAILVRAIRKDSLSADWTNSYSFILPAFCDVRTEGGIGVRPPEQFVVIDEKDTINTIKGSKKYSYKRGSLSGNKHVLLLQDSLHKQ